jgi:clan AA aspartic protease
MGTVITTIEVGDPNGQNFQEVDLEVDTGSNYSALPREMLQALGVPVEASVQSRLANGSLELIEVGETKIRLGGREFTTPVIFAEEGEPSLLGVMALEHALLAVDPVNKELIPVVNKRY